MATWREQPGAWALYLTARRRRRQRQSGFTPASLSGLKLWLDAGLGVFRSWDAVPATGSGTIQYGSGPEYIANSASHSIRVYPFKTVGAQMVFSSAYLELNVVDDNSSSGYVIAWNWAAVAEAEGYRVLKANSATGAAFDIAVDVFTNSLLDDSSALFAGSATVTPQGLASVTDGDPVGAWNDQSGQGNQSAQSTIAKQPSWLANGIGGKPTLRFDGVDDLLRLSSNLTDTVSTVFIVAQTSNNAGWKGMLVTDTLGIYGWLDMGDGGHGWGGFTVTVLQSLIAATMPKILGMTIWSNNQWEIRTNGASPVAGVWSGFQARGASALGADPGDVQHCACDIAEVVFFNRALSSEERQWVELYLTQKYSLA